MDNKFQLWSPPLLDLSLDSFSNDLIQEFDKTRSGVNQLKKSDTTQEQLDSLEVINNNNNNNNNSNHRNNSILSSSPIASSVTLPPSEREISFHEQEEDSSSTANLFRKSSTFLKKKLSQSGHSSHKENSSISTTTTNAEDISNIISRQYPPKPLHYSPVVEPPSDTLQTNLDNESLATSSTHTNTLPRSTREILPAVKTNSYQNRMSNPISMISNSSVSTTTPVSAPTTTTTTTTTTTNTTQSAPKRRSFFSLRFC